MWTNLDPTKLWGRLEQYNNFNRLDIMLDTGIDDGLSNKKDGNPVASSKRLKYGNGLFFIFTTNEERLSIKYKFHHSNSDNYAASRQATVEPQLCARKKGTNTWLMINRAHIIDSKFPEVAEVEWTVEYNLGKQKYDEFQLCLPFGTVVYYVQVDKPIKLVTPKKCTHGFLGSSVTNLSACYAACSLPAQLYRELGINSCNWAIPISHSLVYNKILDKIKNNKIKWYALDTISLCQQNIDNAKKLNVNFKCIKCLTSKYIFDVDYIWSPNNPCYNRDPLHLTTAGAVAFVEKLIPILKKDL